MLLRNANTLFSETTVNIAITGDRISAIDAGHIQVAGPVIDLAGATVLPGLINSHDHLDFNCFSPLGNKIYNNYTEWGKEAFETYRNKIDAVLKIPQSLRTQWGVYKNLLAGVTTVVNHGEHLNIENPLISVIQDIQNLHSVSFERNWKRKLNNPVFKSKLCVIHSGEGSDEPAHAEIDELLRWNLFKRKLVGVHAVAMDARQAKKFTALVWCPESNRVLLNKHANIERLKDATRVVFGTDSTLTGRWDIWSHLRLARELRLCTNEELFEMLTTSPAKLWQINSGSPAAGKDADIIAVKNNAGSWDDIFATEPADILMVIHQGKIRLFDESVAPQLNLDLKNYRPVKINDSIKFVEGDLPALMEEIKKYYPQAGFPCAGIEHVKIPADA
jgi:cytosine/adenosine deaminase-related metal-dependent hydrolase